jgi:hypothetical protein
MAEKVIDVTLASFTNTGTRSVAPYGFISARSVRAVDDEQVFESGLLYDVEKGKPIHSSGALSLKAGNSLTYNSTQRLSIFHFGASESGGFNQMLLIFAGLMQLIVVTGGTNETHYVPSREKVPFDELEGSMNISVPYRCQFEDQVCKFEVNYTVSVISSSG